METADAILVLGKKLNPQNELIEASKVMVQRSVELWREKKAPKVIFSGRWYYQLPPQPITEAQAMAEYARSLGLSEEALILEEESDATISNIYFVKKRILEPRGWRRIILVNFKPFDTRAMMTAQKMLGPEYHVELDLLSYQLPEPKNSEYEAEEQQKVETLANFYHKFKDGDYEGIYQGHLDYVKDHGFTQ